LGIIFPTDELIFFIGVETTNQIMFGFLSHKMGWMTRNQVLTMAHRLIGDPLWEPCQPTSKIRDDRLF
jgi:hypothetical protein